MLKPTNRNGASPLAFASEKFVLQSGWQRMIEGLGASVDECLARAELLPSFAEQEHAYLTTEEMLRFWDAMEALVGPETIVSGLVTYCATTLPPSELAAITSPDLRSALERYAGWKSLTGPVQISLQSDGEQTAITYDFLVAQERLSQSMVIFSLAQILDIAERGIGQRIRPLQAQCANANGTACSLAEKYLGTPLEHGPKMCLVLSDHDLEREFTTSNPQTLAILDRHFADSVPTESPTRTDEVRLWLKRLLPGGHYSIDAIASHLGCSSRQLQRELQTEGTSFSSLLTETRRELALHFLSRNRYTPTEVGYLLGYSELAAFFRAFRRWTGDTPSEYSARTQNSAGAADGPE